MCPIKMKKIVALDQRVRKLSVVNPFTAGTNPLPDKITIKQLCHREMPADISQKIDVINLLKPVIIVYRHEISITQDPLSLLL